MVNFWDEKYDSFAEIANEQVLCTSVLLKFPVIYNMGQPVFIAMRIWSMIFAVHTSKASSVTSSNIVFNVAN